MRRKDYKRISRRWRCMKLSPAGRKSVTISNILPENNRCMIENILIKKYFNIFMNFSVAITNAMKSPCTRSLI